MKSLLLVLCLFITGALFADDTLPVRIRDFGEILPEGEFAQAGNPQMIRVDLSKYFDVPGVTRQVVQFKSNLGTYNVELFPADAPKSVENFLRYVDGNLYDNSVIHRIVPSGQLGIVQGGGFKLTPETSANPIDNVSSFSPIDLEYKLPNARGTIAMARTNVLNSATSQWYINTDDNTTTLGQGNGGGYAVFGRVLGSGINVVDSMLSTPLYNFGGSLAALPLIDYTDTTVLPTRAMFIQFPTVRRINKYPSNNVDAALLEFTFGNVTNPGNATIAINGSILTIEFPPNMSSRADVEIIARDANGNSASGTLVATPKKFSVTLGSNYYTDQSIYWNTNFGFIYTEYYPWIYLFTTERWYYCFGPSTANLWMWNPERGFLWTQDTLYPWVYSTQIGAYINDQE